ncbi:hypothetical protein ATCV1_z721R [Acanthocystis turfacea chlorella virus 1]|uniref:Uncharacterized protein z721R n=1 Tax=Chlorovirus heliozoae TaxID=322019 RepID=A7K9Y1_9PHYC|nr:hypothetical protein ATCV1_z721R [Acanthocystis turfacea chlorella virus 1]ABT16855.1 hypothetical protein ATCV1_z721R [Acanthocystis turfacea chlorella virus 1]
MAMIRSPMVRWETVTPATTTASKSTNVGVPVFVTVSSPSKIVPWYRFLGTIWSGSRYTFIARSTIITTLYL